MSEETKVETETEEVNVEVKAEIKPEEKVEKIKKDRYTPELDKEILELKNAGKSVKEIAEQFGRTSAGITYRLRKLTPVRVEVEEKTEEAKVETIIEA